MMSHTAGRNLLEQIVGSYVGTLIQREHIKNKRLDDIATTAGNYQQQALQTALERVNQKMGASLQLSDTSIGPTVEYGEFPRQLGVTPYPPPPATINLKDEQHSFEDHNTSGSTNPVPPPPPERPISRPEVEPVTKTAAIETAKKAFPWGTTLAGAALAASLATNAYMVYKAKPVQPSQATERLSDQRPTDVNINPTLDLNVDRGMGSVSIGVE